MNLPVSAIQFTVEKFLETTDRKCYCGTTYPKLGTKFYSGQIVFEKFTDEPNASKIKYLKKELCYLIHVLVLTISELLVDLKNYERRRDGGGREGG